MAEVDLKIVGREHRLICEDGQEVDLIAAAKIVEEQAGAIRSASGVIGEVRLLVMTALTLADRLREAERRAGGQDAPAFEAAMGRLERVVAAAEEER